MSAKEYNFDKARRGAVVEVPPNKTRITIRVDTDLLNWFRDQVHKAGGGNYQTLINEALREYIQHRDVRLETTLRRVIREELQMGVKTLVVKRKLRDRQAVPA
jgi:metal-responsive CopG/Arc/MetJ family transcriptional regulator